MRYLGDRAGGVAEVRRLAASDDSREALDAEILAHWAAYYGDPETALALWRRSFAVQGASAADRLWRPLFADMRKLPEFKDLVRSNGLDDYWREFEWADHCRPISDSDFECE
jgi:hypothetical protein